MPARSEVLAGQRLAGRLARTRGVARLDTALWRALAVARAAALVYALVSGAFAYGTWARPVLGLAVLLAMLLWTVVVIVLLARHRTPALLTADVAVAATLLLSGRVVQGPTEIDLGAPSLTLAWGVIPVLAWGVLRGPWAAAGAGAVLGAATVLWKGDLDRPTVGSIVLIVLVGVGVGYVATLARGAERAYADAVQATARQAERDRLARSVHDGVLQTLALVSRESADPALAGLASEQERALRALVAGPAAVPSGVCDLRSLVLAAPDVQVVSPATPVLLPAHACTELAAAVAACVDNVRRHAGGTAWVLLESAPDEVVVTVRDDGPGIAPGRLETASQDGRLGFAQSVRGRVADLGGSVVVVSEPGQGTEVELHVPTL